VAGYTTIPETVTHPSVNRGRRECNYVDRDQRATTKPSHHRYVFTDMLYHDWFNMRSKCHDKSLLIQ